MSLNLGTVSAFVYNQSQKENNKYGSGAASAARMLSASYQRKIENQQNGTTDIAAESMSYADSLAQVRTNTKNTQTQIKRLQYDFKGISSQILKSKTSLNAKQAAGKARREVLRLKRLKGSKEYDDDELAAAITHAQAMERVAKKKARHLQEEELVRAASGKCADSLEGKDDTEEPEKNEAYEGEAYEEESYERESMDETMKEINEESMEALTKFMGESVEESINELTENMEDDVLRDIMEEFGAGEAVDKDMDPGDFKLLKIKHRSKENKEIAKADGEYLKVMFKKYENGLCCASAGTSEAGSTQENSAGGIDISI
jgi:hypothetical protein